MTQKLAEAATIKARVLRISREMDGLLADKAIPEALRKQVETFRASLKKTWKELEAEAGQEGGHKAVAASREDAGEDAPALAEGDYYDYFVPSSITSFAQLDQANAAREVAESMRERVIQFQSMMNNIFFWSSEAEVPDKIAAAQALFDEFIGVVGDVLTGRDAAAQMADAAESAPAGEPGTFAESYAPAVVLAEEDAANPRGPLELDVQLIQPGWGNARDNHYYPREMLARDAKVFEGAKMYATDHRQEEKSVRTEVSQIKRITGFSEAGAPIARVVVFDPDFAEAARNRARAGLLSSLECSILADGRARAGFEEGGRKGKVVEAITAVASVDWVTRAGAGGKALSLAESDAGTADAGTAEDPQPEPAAESDAPAPVTIAEGEEQPEDAPVEQPAAEEQPEGQPEEQPAAEDPQPEPAPEPAPVLPAEAVREALARTHLPASSILELAFLTYADQATLDAAVAAEVQRIKETSGSGRPFGLGETAASHAAPPPPRARIEEAMDRINARYGIGR